MFYLVTRIDKLIDKNIKGIVEVKVIRIVAFFPTFDVNRALAVILYLLKIKQERKKAHLVCLFGNNSIKDLALPRRRYNF